MTERDEVRYPFGCHEPGEPGSRQDIALRDPPLLDHAKGLALHGDCAPSHGLPPGFVFLTDINHAGVAMSVDVSQPLHFWDVAGVWLRRY